MIKVSVFYPNTSGARFDTGYYFSRHMPMVSAKLGAAIKGVSVEQGVAGGAPGSPAPFFMIANLMFDSVEAFQSAFLPHAGEIMGDIPKYTSIDPTIQISEVKVAT